MNYKLFKESLLAELSGHFPPETTIEIQTFQKNNQVSLDGLVILESGFNIAPTIYLAKYYQKIVAGIPFSEVLKDILHAYYEYRPQEQIDVSFFGDFEQLKEQIACKLISYEKNRDFLSKIPYIPYLDLAIVFYCLITVSETETASILIHNSHLKLWGITEKDLYSFALKNTPRLLPFVLRSMDDFLPPELSHHLLCDSDPDSLVQMYVLSNERGLNGAISLIYPDILSTFAQKIGNDFYIIPSSIHEVLLLPTHKSLYPSELNAMIQEVNHTQLSEEEILSDHVYYYSMSQNVLTF